MSPRELRQFGALNALEHAERLPEAVLRLDETVHRAQRVRQVEEALGPVAVAHAEAPVEVEHLAEELLRLRQPAELLSGQRQVVQAVGPPQLGVGQAQLVGQRVEPPDRRRPAPGPGC